MARYRRSRWRELIATIGILLLVAIRWWSAQPTSDSSPYPAGRLQPGVYAVRRVVDGDTLDLAGPRIRIRLQGVDTPETVNPNTPVQPWGREASDFTRRFIDESGDRVRVEISGEPLDQHGRHLAFLWHGDRLLNEELVNHGLAHATLQYDFSERMKERLRRAQRAAKRARVGIWSH
jgi:micrococcal nuclease